LRTLYESVPREAGQVHSACMARPPVCPEAIGLLGVIKDICCGPLASEKQRKEMLNMKTRRSIGFALAALLLVSVIGLASAVSEDTGEMGILSTPNLGGMYTDGTGDTASASAVGSVTVPAGQNTFTAAYRNVNDIDNDGQGAIYRLKVYDANGAAHTTEKRVDRATSGTISVSFNSQGSGDAQYELWCETHDWFDTTKATDTDYGDLDYV